MVGAIGSSHGERVSTTGGRAVPYLGRRRPPRPDAALIASALLWQMLDSGLTPADIHRVITRLPRCRRATFYRCGELANVLGDREAG